MTISAGMRLGHYEIVSAIGAGGMGQVYRARDTRLDRTVAIKVLPDAFASNPQLRLRFEREAKVISSLSHPNICTLHDVGSENGIEYLVMEHLEGETLAERIAKGPLPLADVYRYGIEIAEALARAHRAGVIHRDLKPGNIMITRDGAKLLDFGLAKVARPGSVDVTAAIDAPTQRRDDLTSEGTVLGTYQYMAPEQLEGIEADARSDIFAFGVVLYEMLTGKRAFGGKTRASVIAAILAAEPAPVATLRPMTPSGLERLVRTCLSKDPDERWQSAHDLKLELENLRSAGEAPGTAPVKRRLRLPWAVAALVAVVAIGLGVWGARRGGETPVQPLSATISASGIEFNVVDGPAAIAPDGRSLVVRVRGLVAGAEVLAVRRLDSTEFVALQGTAGAIDPFWSPDSAHIAFFLRGKLYRIPATGGPITTLCDSGSDPRGGTWGRDVILFSPSPNGAIRKVPATGGTPVEVLKLDAARGEIGQWRPQFLPDGRHFIYHSPNSAFDKSAIYVADIDGKTPPRHLIDAATTAIYAPPGHLLYAYNGDLYAQAFDADALEKRGSPTLLSKNVEYDSRYGSAGYSVAANGTLVLHTWEGEAQSNLVAVARDGSETSLGLDGSNLDLSRDENRIAMQRIDQTSRAFDLWALDLKRGTRTRVTFDPYPDLGPVWSPDGSKIAYVSQRAGYFSVNMRSSSGAGPITEVLRHTTALEVTDWSNDGRYLIAEVFNEQTSADIYVIDLQGDRQLRPLIANQFAEDSPRLSRDGRFLSYQSNEGGTSDVYVQTFPAGDQRWQITSGGGMAARWSADGRELIYVTRDRQLAAVSIDTSNGFEIGKPVTRGRALSQDITHQTANGTVYISMRPLDADSIVLITRWDRVLMRGNAP